MNDDWRLHIGLREHGIAGRLGEALQAAELEHDLERSFSDKVVVSVDGADVFCYAGSRAQAEAAQRLIERIAAHERWQATIELAHWHPVAERWEPADEALPEDREQLAAERAQRVADERAESAQQGYPEYEIRVQCGSRHDARELVDRLGRERIPAISRWSVVLIGADDEDAANQVAQRLRSELSGVEIAVELNARAAWSDLPRSPFIVLGGLAG